MSIAIKVSKIACVKAIQVIETLYFCISGCQIFCSFFSPSLMLTSVAITLPFSLLPQPSKLITQHPATASTCKIHNLVCVYVYVSVDTITSYLTLQSHYQHYLNRHSHYILHVMIQYTEAQALAENCIPIGCMKDSSPQPNWSTLLSTDTALFCYFVIANMFC